VDCFAISDLLCTTAQVSLPFVSREIGAIHNREHKQCPGTTGEPGLLTKTACTV
jgi:hypothetical protein